MHTVPSSSEALHHSRGAKAHEKQCCYTIAALLPEKQSADKDDIILKKPDDSLTNNPAYHRRI